MWGIQPCRSPLLACTPSVADAFHLLSRAAKKQKHESNTHTTHASPQACLPHPPPHGLARALRPASTTRTRPRTNNTHTPAPPRDASHPASRVCSQHRSRQQPPPPAGALPRAPAAHLPPRHPLICLCRFIYGTCAAWVHECRDWTGTIEH